MLTVFSIAKRAERDDENKQAETYQNCTVDYQQLKLLVKLNTVFASKMLLSKNLSLQGLIKITNKPAHDLFQLFQRHSFCSFSYDCNYFT